MIDERAVIHPSARLDEDVEVGPYAIIGPEVQIGAGTRIGPHAFVKGPARIGRDNRIFQFASVGDDPQDKKYGGEPTWLEIGDRNVIREYCTINRGTVQDEGVTRIGDDNWIMAYVHIAHDCQVGSNTVFANNASLAGHVRIEDHVILGGFTLVHQFCSIGTHSFTSYSTGISKDIPPYLMVSGSPARPHGLNSEGLRRHGFPVAEREALRKAYKTLYRSGSTLEQALKDLRELAQTSSSVATMVAFIENRTRGIIR
ncbi:MAG TPA: acyl-ACP--UDP-N-acetylglucosamine O-acyltransferase [Gammaproteobacteria bacterium]|nr:acyl-ACP--UDP-N-acetylglucosamine O-acyltransferase [Gammaproteobacteria bacterium]